MQKKISLLDVVWGCDIDMGNVFHKYFSHFHFDNYYYAYV